VVSRQIVSSADKGRDLAWRLGEGAATEVTEYENLGLLWEAGSIHPNTDVKVKMARRTAYSLMGAGLHGRNGLDPLTALDIIRTYVIPRVLHGLDATILSHKKMDALNQYHKTLLKQLQGFPPNVTTQAVYLMIGSLPICAQMDIRYLAMLGAVARLSPNNPLRQIGIRQLATKDKKSKSWFVNTARVGESYGIDVHKALLYPPPKQAWKKHIKCIISEHWWGRLMLKNEQKKPLTWQIIDRCWVGKPHPLWLACRGKVFQVEAATTRALLFSGRFGLQAERVNYTKQDTSSTCLLCGTEEEDVTHFLTGCPKHEGIAEGIIRDLQDMYTSDSK
jgi:hypothetical protein